MQAITTKYLGPTNTHTARIKATAAGGLTATVVCCGSSALDSHRKAVAALFARHELTSGWEPVEHWHAGTLNAHGDYVWVNMLAFSETADLLDAAHRALEVLQICNCTPKSDAVDMLRAAISKSVTPA